MRECVGKGAQRGQGRGDRTACAHPAQAGAACAVLDIGAVAEPGAGARVEDQVDSTRGGARQVEVQFLGYTDEGGQALLPDLGGGPDIGARRPQLGRVLGQQCPEQGVPVVVGKCVEPRLSRLEGTCLHPEQRERVGAGLLDGCGQQGGGLEGTDSGGRVERFGGLRAPGRRALLPYQRGEPGEPVTGDAVPVHVLVVQGESGDGAEGAGRIVVQGEPACRVVQGVPAPAGEDHDGAVPPAEHLAEAVHGLGASRPGRPCGDRFDELHLPDRSRRVGQRARGKGLQEHEEPGAVLGGGGRRGSPVGQFGQIVEEGGPGQGVAGHGVLVPLPAVHGGERDLGHEGRAECGLAAEHMVDGEDLPDHGPPAPGSPPAAAHPRGVPGRGGLQRRVVAVLGLVIEEHALGARGVAGRGRLRGLGRFQVLGGCDGPVHRAPDERGDAREEPCVGHLGQHPGEGLLAHLPR